MRIWQLSTTADVDPADSDRYVTTGHWVDIRVPRRMWRGLMRIKALPVNAALREARRIRKATA